VRQLTRLIEGLLDRARVRQGKMDLRKEVLDLNAIVTRAVESARPVLDGRGHDRELALPLGPVPLEADPSRLEQVVANLLTNAGKYTEPGGRIRLAVECADDEVAVRVRDTGIGLAPDMLGRVFHLYAQVQGAHDHAQSGLGIGLALVRGIVELHGGSVQAYSDGPGQGSEFVVRLPAPPVAPRPQSEGGGEADLPTARRLRVLVVDDNLDGAESLATLLRH
jgi:signal transduction histidine kinase